MQRQTNAVHGHGFPVRDGLNRCIGPETLANDPFSARRAQIRAGAGAKVIAVGVRDDRALDRLPGIDVESACVAVQARRRGLD
jgi:hypothetical protein